MTNLVGQILKGRYRVESSLGRGGMAEVFKVWDTERATYLALKLLRDDIAEDKVFLRRFKREAHTLAKLQHPNIVRFYGLEQQGNLAFMLMDFIEGHSLRKEIFESDEPFTNEKILKVMQPICAALHYAHRQGFVHCDIKPGNILINKAGHIFLSDFGIARVTDSATATMVGAGTPAYMAPEQARGEDVVPQTDIYALGVMLYEMLTNGERPFVGEHAEITGSTSEKVRWEHLHLEPPSPRMYSESINHEVEQVVLTCLQKDLQIRFSSVLDVINKLVVAFHASEKSVVDVLENKNILFPVQVEKTADTGSSKINLLSKLIEKFSDFRTNLKYKLFLLTDKLNDLTMKQVLLNKKNILGISTLIFIGIVLLSPMPFWNPQGGAYFSGVRSGKMDIYWVSNDGVIQLIETQEGQSKHPAWKDKNRLYFVSNVTGKSEIYSLFKGEIARITNTPGEFISIDPSFSPTGDLFFASDRSGKLEIYLLNQNNTSQITHTKNGGESWSPAALNRNLVYFVSNRDGKREIYVIYHGVVSRVTYTPDHAESWSPVVSANGILYFVSNRDGNSEIYLLDKGIPKRITQSGKGNSFGPVIDGNTMWFTSDRNGKKGIFSFNDKGILQPMNDTIGFFGNLFTGNSLFR